MLTLHIQADFATFRKPFAREYRATEILPPPSTCYGFLLSLAGITRERYHEHVGVRLAPALLCEPEKSVVLRKIHRLKTAKEGVTSIPDYQEVLSGIDMLLFIDSSEEETPNTLESVVTEAILRPSSVNRFGPLCLGESESIVNSVDIIDFDTFLTNLDRKPRAFLLNPDGLMSLTTWPDYDQCATTQWAKGDLAEISSVPSIDSMPIIAPSSTSW